MLVNTAEGGELFMGLLKSTQLSNWMKSGEKRKASPKGDVLWKKEKLLCETSGIVNSQYAQIWMG